jgi:hypothetical protein
MSQVWDQQGVKQPVVAIHNSHIFSINFLKMPGGDATGSKLWRYKKQRTNATGSATGGAKGSERTRLGTGRGQVAEYIRYNTILRKCDSRVELQYHPHQSFDVKMENPRRT